MNLGVIRPWSHGIFIENVVLDSSKWQKFIAKKPIFSAKTLFFQQKLSNLDTKSRVKLFVAQA